MLKEKSAWENVSKFFYPALNCTRLAGYSQFNPIPGGLCWSSERRGGGAFWPAGMKMPIKPL